MSAVWLTAEQIQQRYGFPFVTLHHWRRVLCPVLGRRLRARKVRGRGRRPAHEFLEAEIRAVFEHPVFTGEYRDAAGVWLSTRLAKERFGFTPDRLTTWRTTGSPQLAGRKLRAQRVKVLEATTSGRRVASHWVHHAEDLAAIAAGVGQDTEWLTHRDARQRYGFKQQTLWLWSNRGCPHLGGRRLYSARIRRVQPETYKGRPIERTRHVRAYRATDLEELAGAIETSPAASADADWLTYREAGLLGFSQSALSSWALTGCRHLGGRRLAARRVLAGVGNRAMKVWKYRRADLEEIARQRGLPLPWAGVGGQANGPGAASRPIRPLKRRRGRRPDPAVAQVYQFCWERYVRDGRKLSWTRRAAELEFENRAPKDDQTVRLYAQRHAQRHGLSMERAPRKNP